jgi:6-phosphofructokinase 2
MVVLPAGSGVLSNDAVSPISPIITLTMNPALDVSTSTERVVSEHKMRCGVSRLDPGGGGVNVSRVIHRLGGHSFAVYAVGGPTGEAYRRLIEAEGVPTRAVPIAGSTRENFTIDETATDKQFRFVLQGPTLDESEWGACLAALERGMQPGGFVVASGSLPPGVPDDFYARVVKLAKERGARCIVDSSGPALTETLRHGVFMIKPSRRELSELVGSALGTEQSQLDAAVELIERGAAEFVALTLGADGAILASKDGVVRLPAPTIVVDSTVGAGDSFLGGFVLRLAQGRSPEQAFVTAVAAGSATAMLPATQLCTPHDVARLERELLAGDDGAGSVAPRE